LTIGTIELAEYVALFNPTSLPVPAAMAHVLKVPTGQSVAYYPRRSFDLWGARYFLLPAVTDWSSMERGLASFLAETELIYPSADVLNDRQHQEGQAPWGVRQDWQLRRNRAAYPRAWIVHSARVRSPALSAGDRSRLLTTLLYMNDPIWRNGERPVLDLRQTALIEVDDKNSLKGFISPTPVGALESVVIVKNEPGRVELLARLERPGLVILADTFYPGWRLTIDGKTEPIYRANLLMRAAAVPIGEHKLTYTYEPWSVRVGAFVSGAGLIVLTALIWRAWKKAYV